MLDIITDTLLDTAKMLPFLFLAYLLIEYIEHKKSHKIEALLVGTGKFGFVGGALLGIFPQCGFSVAAANFYAGRVITMGTLVSVFIATSDEAIPVLLTVPESWGMIVKLIAAKLLIAVIAGFLTDAVLRLFLHKDGGRQQEHIHEEVCDHCGCDRHGILYAALRHTVSIAFFILVVSLLLNVFIASIGEERLSSLFLNNTLLQPVVSVLIGLIPNCASSVLLTELLVRGSISFGSAVAGLCAGAGAGLLVLFHVNKRKKENFCVLGMIAAVGIVSGWLLQLLGI